MGGTPKYKSTEIDSGSPAGFINVGPSFDVTLPGPVYFSNGKFSSADVQLLSCSSPAVECAPDNTDYEVITHEIFGIRMSFRSSHALSIKLPSSSYFSNSNPMIPIYWMKEFSSLPEQTMYYYLQYDLLTFEQTEFTVAAGIVLLSWFICIVLGWYRACTANSLDISSVESDKCMV